MYNVHCTCCVICLILSEEYFCRKINRFDKKNLIKIEEKIASQFLNQDDFLPTAKRKTNNLHISWPETIQGDQLNMAVFFFSTLENWLIHWTSHLYKVPEKHDHILTGHLVSPRPANLQTMDRNSFCSDVVLDRFNKASRDKCNILDEIYEKQIC